MSGHALAIEIDVETAKIAGGRPDTHPIVAGLPVMEDRVAHERAIPIAHAKGLERDLAEEQCEQDRASEEG